VKGLSARHLFTLFSEAPQIRRMIEERKDSTPQELMMTLAPSIVGRIVAMATGLPQNAEVEERVLDMSPDDLLNILEAVQRLSFRNGIGPFVDRMTSLIQMSRQDSKPSSNSTTKSPARSSASLQMDTPGLMHGLTRRVN